MAGHASNVLLLWLGLSGCCQHPFKPLLVGLAEHLLFFVTDLLHVHRFWWRGDSGIF